MPAPDTRGVLQENLGHFVPVGDNPDHKLIFFLGSPDQPSASANWAAFLADEEWLKIKADSEPNSNGGLVARVENQFMGVTDYSPTPGPSKNGGVFELRTYTSDMEKLLALHARFRDHTLGLFDKHGMRNIAYFAPYTPLTQSFPPVDPAETASAQGQLVYMLGHDSVEAAGAPGQGGAWNDFIGDFMPILLASHEAAGGSLTIMPQDEGVKNEFLEATDYSAVQ